MKTNIKFVQQKLLNDCTSACLAMLLNKDLEVIHNEFHHEYHKHQIEVNEYLISQRMPFTEMPKFYNVKDVMFANNIYLVTVPSINLVGGLHHILIEVFEDVYNVIDPNQNRPNKNWYVKSGAPKNSIHEIELKSFILDLSITFKDFLDYEHILS